MIIKNTGGRDVVISQIEIRGQPVFPTEKVYLQKQTWHRLTSSQQCLAATPYLAGLTTAPLVLAAGKVSY